MTSFSCYKLHVFHGGEFQRFPNLIYSEFKCSEVQFDPHMLSMNDIKEIVSK